MFIFSSALVNACTACKPCKLPASHQAVQVLPASHAAAYGFKRKKEIEKGCLHLQSMSTQAGPTDIAHN
jgi:hypothetical protein